MEKIQQLSLQEPQTQCPMFCSGKVPALHYCTNLSCAQQELFSCGQRKCQCQKQHVLCLKGNIEGTLQLIQSKIYSTEESILNVQKVINKLIDDLSEFEEWLIGQIEERMKYTRMHQVERKFLKVYHKEIDGKQLRAEQMNELWSIINTEYEPKFDVFEQSRQALESFQNQCQKMITKTKQQIQREISKQELVPKSKLTKPKEPNASINLPINDNLCKKLSQTSSICNSLQLSERMISIFKERKVCEVEVLWRASQNGFSLPRFYQKCGGEQNTIILIQTEKGKILGGYTPFCFFNGKNEWVKDEARQTFLFSLSENQIFPLLQSYKHQAIERYSNRQHRIRFGNDLAIYPNANISPPKNWIYSQYFINQKYKNDKQSWMKLLGQNQNCFCIKQWEMIKVVFEK